MIHPPPLPRPPLLAHHILEQPWPLAIALAAGGVLAAWIFNRRARAKQGSLVGTALILLGVAVAVAGSLIATTRETLIARTRDLVAAAARADTSALDSLLARDVIFRLFTTTRRYPRNELLGLVRRYPGERYPVESHREESEAATIDGPSTARTQVRVVTHSTAATIYNIPVGSWWRIEWRSDPEGEWLATGIECLQIDGVSAGSAPQP